MTRKKMPTKIRDAVLKEYKHKCAICGVDEPQVHHIDEDPSNNELENLLPLCPKCHLTDQHNPTRKIDIQKLILFRKYKDPAILKPQFDPLYKRQIFLSEVEINDEPTNSLEQQAHELTYFISFLDMGKFYEEKISQLMRPVGVGLVGGKSVRILTGEPDPEYEKEYKNQKRKSYRKYRQKLVDNKAEIQSLIVELLRYQAWAND
jgi:hypothetical protein